MAKKGGNPQNLKVPTSAQARINGRKGGIKSQKVQRVNKTIKQLAEQMLNTKIEMSEEAIKSFEEIGINADEICGKVLMLHGMYAKACSGDSQAYDRLCKAIGEEEAAGDDAVKINITVGGVPINDDKNTGAR